MLLGYGVFLQAKLVRGYAEVPLFLELHFGLLLRIYTQIYALHSTAMLL